MYQAYPFQLDGYFNLTHMHARTHTQYYPYPSHPPLPLTPSPSLPSSLLPLPSPPEILLCLAWLALLVLGIVVQSLLSCRRPPFPSQSLYHKWSQKRNARRERRELGLSHNQKGLRTLAGSPQETSPLLGPSASRGSHRLN